MARIVLIDDEAPLRAVLGELLAAAGHETVMAEDGAAGLAAIRRDPPDVVLCDINMPGMDGFAVLRAIRDDPTLAWLPFVFLTSVVEVRAGMLSGADDYLVKPFAGDDLIAAIDARLARDATTRREADRRVDEMRRAVAVLLPHELRTPLTTIIGAADLMREFGAEIAPAEIVEMGARILKAAERLHRMAENYILYADLELRRLSTAGPRQPSLSGSSGAEEVRAAAEQVAAASDRGGDLALDLADVEVPMAPAYLRKIAAELCDNAFKFSEGGTPVEVSLRAEDGGRVLEIADRGRGLPEGAVRRLGAFQQFDRALFEQQGSGVGLALVRGLMAAAGGRLELSGRSGGGTIARAVWPA